MNKAEKEIRKQMLELYKPQMNKFREMMDEVNGKVMDYQSCRIIEETFEVIINQTIDTYLEMFEEIKKQLEKSYLKRKDE